MKTIIEALEHQADTHTNNVAFSDVNESVTYCDLERISKSVGSSLINHLVNKEPVCIMMDKSIKCIEAMFGIVYSGCFYIVLDPDSPFDRIQKILNTLNSRFIICDVAKQEKIQKLLGPSNIKLLPFEELVKSPINDQGLTTVRNNSSENDLLYVLFTSGSTGNPKGVKITHKNVICYINWFIHCFNITSSNVFGNQTPFYFSMSVTDIYGTLFSGAELVIIPKSYFAFPVQLVNFMNEKKIDTVYWVPSVFSIISFYKLFDYVLPKHLRLVLFAGEVMQVKWLNYFMSRIPDAKYANLFGPTETTDICTYYKVNRHFNDSDSLPIGKESEGLHVFLVDKDNKVVDKPNITGEMYSEGPFVSSGYYCDEKRTAKAFMKNPSDSSDPNICYKSGDICQYNELGELLFVSRADFQIKHMGYRIELGEIESSVISNNKVMECVCIYDNKSDNLILFYTGTLKEDALLSYIKGKVPPYMAPNAIIKENSIIHKRNGKIDRKYYSTNLEVFISEKNGERT